MSDTNYQKGLSLLFVVLIMSVILSVGLGLSGILIQQTKTIGEIGHSVVSFYAADSGIEGELYQLYKAPLGMPLASFTDILVGDAMYSVEAKCGSQCLVEECPEGFDMALETECDTLNYCIQSIGTFKQTKRAIRIQY